MAHNKRRSTPLEPSSLREVSEPQTVLQDVLRGLAEEMDALTELAVAIDQHRAALADLQREKGKPFQRVSGAAGRRARHATTSGRSSATVPTPARSELGASEAAGFGRLGR